MEESGKGLHLQPLKRGTVLKKKGKAKKNIVKYKIKNLALQPFKNRSIGKNKTCKRENKKYLCSPINFKEEKEKKYFSCKIKKSNYLCNPLKIEER